MTISDDKQIISTLVNVRNGQNATSTLETQFLYGERVKVLKVKKGFSYVQSKQDNYRGWIKSKHIGKLENTTYKIKSVFSFIFNEPNMKSKVLGRLYFNSNIEVLSTNYDWYEIIINKKLGFIHKKSLTNKDLPIKNWLENSKKFLNVPYLWGGKSFSGIDCSGLLQLSLQSCGVNFPRNTSEQINFQSENIESTSVISKGAILFWSGHVGIAIDEKNLIHSNMFHLGVNIEPISNVIKRIGKISEIKKIIF